MKIPVEYRLIPKSKESMIILFRDMGIHITEDYIDERCDYSTSIHEDIDIYEACIELKPDDLGSTYYVFDAFDEEMDSIIEGTYLNKESTDYVDFISNVCVINSGSEASLYFGIK